jgi:porin
VSTFVEASYKATIDRQLEGTYTLGGFYDSKSFTRLADGTSAHGNYGVYAIADQQIWREGEGADERSKGAAVFARVAVAPPDRNAVNYDFETGINYTGVIPGRNADVIGAAFLLSRISDDVPREQVGFPPDHEAVFELTYQAPISEWLTMQPDFQYVWHPAGVSGARNAVVAGMRFSLAF